MKIQIASDLHLEGRPRQMPEADAFTPVFDRQVLVLAGDIGTDLVAKNFLMRELDVSPVIYVPGNHEYYSKRNRSDIDQDWEAIAAQTPGLHYLAGKGATIGGVRFWGAPWYSDLWGTTDPSKHPTILRGVPDFWKPYDSAGEWDLAKHIQTHRAQTELLAEQAGKVDVMITHWPPTLGAMHPSFKGDELSPYFYNDHEDLVRQIGAGFWVSGHTHEAYTYQVGDTICVGNPTGYLGGDRESRLFGPDRTIEVHGAS